MAGVFCFYGGGFLLEKPLFLQLRYASQQLAAVHNLSHLPMVTLAAHLHFYHHCGIILGLRHLQAHKSIVTFFPGILDAFKLAFRAYYFACQAGEGDINQTLRRGGCSGLQRAGFYIALNFGMRGLG